MGSSDQTSTSTDLSHGSWLVCNDRVLASLEIAITRKQRRQGLLGREQADGAMLLRPAKCIHTVGMKFAIDVAYVDEEQRVIRMDTMTPNRLGPIVRRSRAVIECDAGSLQRWGIKLGDVLEFR
ncbi:MAG: hypothetical protein RLZZ31_1071 [Actinomycetota bacterium]|jgi:uncharacterized membrane protein (UPF0127 family)